MQEAQGTQVQSLGWEDPLEEEMVTLSNILAWGIPRTEEPGGLQFMGFSLQERWSGLPFPPPGDLPHSRIKPGSPASVALAGRFLTTEPPGKPEAVAMLHIKEEL